MDGRTDRGRKLALVFQDKGNGVVRVFTGWGFKPEEKPMKKKFANLSKAEQEEIEAWYHNMDPQEVVDILSRAAKHHPRVKSSPKLSRKVSRKLETAPKPHASK